VQNVILVLGRKTQVGCGVVVGSKCIIRIGMKKSNYKKILSMKYPTKGIKLLWL
jgi:hypothetical protein